MRKGLFPALVLLLFSSVAAQATGAFFHNGSIQLSDFEGLVEVQQGDRSEFNATNGTVRFFDRDAGLNMPTGYIVLILAFLLVVVYAVDIDPFWIAILLFLVAFTVAVSYLGLPRYLVPLAAVIIAGVKHFR